MGEMRAGELIADRFELRGPLGRGGMASTWRAFDKQTGTEVALKRLHVGSARDWKHIELFEREAKILSQLVHPSIPRYLGAFTTEGPDGTSYFLAQTLIEGRSLAEHVASHGRMTEAEVRDIAAQTLGILKDLHKLVPQVLHRDLKPANIVVDAEKRIHLVDFGAARQRSEETGSTVVGTYGFMVRGATMIEGSCAASDLVS